MGNCVVKEAVTVKASTAASIMERGQGGGRVRVEEARNVISLTSMSCPSGSSSSSSGDDHHDGRDGTSCSIVSKRKKSVSFKLGDDGFEQVTVTGKMKRGSSPSGGAPVRIRVVLTQAELNRILMTARSDYRYSSSPAAEQLGFMNVNNMTRGRRSASTVARAMRRRRTINDVGASVDGGWTPALECIPEDH